MDFYSECRVSQNPMEIFVGVVLFSISDFSASVWFSPLTMEADDKAARKLAI